MNKDHFTRIVIIQTGTAEGMLLANAVYSLLTALGRHATICLLREFNGASETTDLCICTSLHAALKIRESFLLPILVYDADLFGRRRGTEWRKLGAKVRGCHRSAFNLQGREFHLFRAVPDLTILENGVESTINETFLYCLPVFLCLEFKQADCFYRLCLMLERQIAGLLKRERFLYVSPWPKGSNAAVAFTLDADGVAVGETSGTLSKIVEPGRRVTYFACAAHLEKGISWPDGVEVACHGDTHDIFDASNSSKKRLGGMLEHFRSVGLDPSGFSPPYLFFDRSRESLMEAFAYVRIGHMEKRLLFFPKRKPGNKDCFFVPVSGYSDHLMQDIGTEAYLHWLRRYIRWAGKRKQLSVFCFHPFQFGTDFCEVFKSVPQRTWVASLNEIVDWWKNRNQWIERLKRVGGGQGPSGTDQAGKWTIEAVSRRWDDNLAVCFPEMETEEALAQGEVGCVKGQYGRTVINNIGGAAKKDVEIELPAIKTRLSKRRWVVPDNPVGLNGLLSVLVSSKTLLRRTTPTRIRLAYMFEDEVFGFSFQGTARRLQKQTRNILKGRPANLGDFV